MGSIYLQLKKRKKQAFTLLFMLILVLAYLVYPRIPEPPSSVGSVAELDAYLEQLVNAGTPQGLSMLIVKDDSIVYNKGFGWADYPRKIKATPHTVYHWWSITKIPTAMAVLQLQEQGKLHLDHPVSNYLPFFQVSYPSEKKEEVTIKHLLNHSSGIPDASALNLTKWIHHDVEVPVNQTDLIEAVFSDFSSLKFHPGTDTDYTNIGYMLLGAIIEKVSGESYRDYIKKNILDPLEMEQTNFEYTNEMGPYEAAGSHSIFSPMAPLFYTMIGSYIRETSNMHLWMERVYTDQEAPSALIGSTTDAARFMRAYLNKGSLDGRRIFSENSIEMMTNGGHATKTDDDGAYFFRQGMGWMVFKERGGYKLEHTGGGPGFYTIMQIFPEEKMGLVLFCNDMSLEKFGWKILNLGASLEW